jgi:AraC-like DNA-binding protein
MGQVPPWFVNEWANTAFRMDGVFSRRFNRGVLGRAGQRDMWTFYAVTEGVLRLRQGAWTADLTVGDQAILTPDSPFTREVLSDFCGLVVIDFRIEATGFGSDPLPALGLPAKVHVPVSPEWLTCLRDALSATASESGVLKGRGAADQIIGRYLKEGIESGAITTSRRAFVPPWLGMIRQRIAQAFWIPDADLAGMAREAGFSSSYLRRVFKKSFGSTPTEYLWEQRLQIAARKLDTDPSLAVGGVAANCGFKSHTHFTRMFRRRFAMTPQQWRRRHFPTQADKTAESQHARQGDAGTALARITRESSRLANDPG